MNKLIKKIIIFAFIVFIFIIALNGLGGNKIQALNVVLFIFISILAIYGILDDFSSHSFSLIIMHWLFVLIFFVIAPVIQYSFGYFPWKTSISNSELSYIQLLVITWSLFFYVGCFLGKKYKINILKIEKKYKNFQMNKIIIVLLTILSIISTIIIIKNVGFLSLFSRSTSMLTYDSEYSQMEALIVDKFTKITILFSVICSYVYYIRNKKLLIPVIINSLLLLITCFPTGLSRNTAGIIYMGLFVILFYKNFNKIKNSLKYILLFLLAFIVLFPAINVYRSKTIENVNFKETIVNTIDNISSNYLSGDYDAFAMVGNIRKYVNINGVVHGKQLIGNLLFFVPRFLWESKPIGSGSLVISSFGYKFTNVSCPLIAEWHLNFGFFGVIFGGLIFGLICSRIDKIYWYIMNNSCYKDGYITFLYPFLVPAFFFMMRGDFLSSFSYTSAYIILFWIYTKLLKIKISIK